MAGLNNKADPVYLEKSQAMWVNFTGFMKWGIISVVALLVLMALFLV